ncbi:MAG: sulfite exporter TauE/SafE family protein [Bacteroidales bacterium]|nr:sulfite exporter TauE/SafE family protein [Bacteroidales bacterium]
MTEKYVFGHSYFFTNIYCNPMLAELAQFLSTTPLNDWRIITILLCVGFIVGFINTIAGMASAISYALFMAMGMPVSLANGTTRFGVLVQMGVTSSIFHKAGYLDMKLAFKVGIAVAAGSAIGAELVTLLPSSIVEISMGVMLPVMAVLLFIDKSKLSKKHECDSIRCMSWWKYAVFVLVGIYGGFTHAGAGVLIMLGVFYMLGEDLVRSNAIRQFVVLVYTPVALTIFMLHNDINWPVALIYAIGNVAGGILGAKASIKKGDKLIKVSVAVMVVLISIWFIKRNIG